ncbi:MAG: Dabb family protein [Chlorobiales bacterium]|nr:Dabb family protein [Chlorobiales bacterium]
MIKHLVFWKLKETAEGSDKAGNGAKIKRMIEALAPLIPGVICLEVGFNFTQSDTASDVALYSEFESKDALETYQKHPEHIKVAEFVRQVTLERRVVDYEA